MKLYNIYTNLILENIKQKISLFEAVSGSLIDTVLAGDNQRPGKHYRVNIRYKNQKGEVSNQFIEINQKNIFLYFSSKIFYFSGNTTYRAFDYFRNINFGKIRIVFFRQSQFLQ